MGDSKPIEILPEMTSLNYEQNSLSAYVSAESSPSQIDVRLVDEPYFPKSDNNSLNTYWGLPPASSLLIDEEDKQDALNHSREKMSQSKSFHDSQNLNKLNDDKEYQSLPVEKTQSLDKTLEEKVVVNKEQTELKKELSESDLFKLNVVEGEEDLVNVDLKENATNKTNQLPEMSKPKTKSSTMAFIESIFSSKKPTQVTEPETKEVKQAEVLETKQTLTAALSTAATSASSPNPECSPYKFLMNEYSVKTNEQKAVSSLKLNTEQTSDTVKTEAVDEKLMENLASLNRKESEKHDPILSGANSSKKTTEIKNAASTKTSKPEKKASTNKSKTTPVTKSSTRSPTKSSSSIALSSGSVDSSKVDHVPASSREFCMDLNFNLASAAAATAGGPIVVVDNTNKSPVAKEHDKFTSNASTSSIHNDLKMILEESKDVKKSNKTEKKLNKSTDSNKKDKPKPQRLKKESKNTSKNNVSNTSISNSTADTTTNSMTVETGNLSPTSKTNNLNLIKMMMLMVESNNTKKDENILKKHQQQETNVEEVSLIELVKQNGRYKYTKEFLMEIREQRSAFINQIHPDIFKAYCYCMNGKYWDPEKYFDIVQFPGDYDRIQSNRSSYNRSQSYNKINNNKYKKNTPNGTFNNSQQHYKNLSVGTTPTAVPNHMNDDSPQPLQVPKNSPKFIDNKSKESSIHSIFESLGINTNQVEDKSKLDADKILLGLIKKDQQANQNTNLMDILNKKQNVKKTQSPNILDNLFSQQSKPQETAKNNKHYPLVLSAQELEMSQMNQEKLSKHKLPNEISMTKLEELQQSMESNDSFAYKQLVKNLSNHPLTNSNTTLNNKLEASLNKLQNKHKFEKTEKRDTSKPSWQVSNDGTNMLKQLLNLKCETNVKQAKPKKQHHHKSKSPHLSMSNGSNSGSSSTGSSPIESTNKFPSVNPHEKPFETYMAEENRKQIEHVVASALSQVLSKSPNSLKQLSPAPKSPIQDLIEKINIQHKEQDLKNTQHEHFNSLLNKMNAQQNNQKRETNNDSNILKWFSDVKIPSSRSNNQMSAQSLSEIEFMQMNRPATAVTKFY